MSSEPAEPQGEVADGATSPVYDALSAMMDEGDHNCCDAALDDLCLFIERKGLADEAIEWLHGRIAGTIPGRTPYAG